MKFNYCPKCETNYVLISVPNQTFPLSTIIEKCKEVVRHTLRMPTSQVRVQELD